MTFKERFIKWLVFNGYIVVTPKSETIEEAQEAMEEAIQIASDMAILSRNVEQMSRRIKLANKEKDIVQEHIQRSKLRKIITQAKQQGLL